MEQLVEVLEDDDESGQQYQGDAEGRGCHGFLPRLCRIYLEMVIPKQKLHRG